MGQCGDVKQRPTIHETHLLQCGARGQGGDTRDGTTIVETHFHQRGARGQCGNITQGTIMKIHFQQPSARGQQCDVIETACMDGPELEALLLHESDQFGEQGRVDAGVHVHIKPGDLLRQD